MADQHQGHATIQQAAADCVLRLTASTAPAFIEVLIQPQPENVLSPYVSSAALEQAIRLESAKRNPPTVWAMLQCEIKRMHRGEGTTLVARGVTR